MSHAHEDHVAGLRHHAGDVYAHEQDVASVRSHEHLLAGYGLTGVDQKVFETELHEIFSLADRPAATSVIAGHRFDLGGVTATVVHLPGHTAGHCGLLIEPDGFFYIGDIDLTSFGPFYGDPGSSLTDFERSIDTVATVDAARYGTFHQKGVITGKSEFRERLERYRDVISARDRRVVELCRVPQSIESIADHRLVYRPHVSAPYVVSVERRTASRHLKRLSERGVITEIAPGLYRSSSR